MCANKKDKKHEETEFFHFFEKSSFSDANILTKERSKKV